MQSKSFFIKCIAKNPIDGCPETDCFKKAIFSKILKISPEDARFFIAEQQTEADFKRIYFHGLYCSISWLSSQLRVFPLPAELISNWHRFSHFGTALSLHMMLVGDHTRRNFVIFVFVSHFSKKGWQHWGRNPFHFTSCLTFCREWFSVIFHFSRLRSRAERECSLEAVPFLAFMLILSSPGSTGTANNWWK